MTEKEITKCACKCADFGNPEGDVGTCVDCSEENEQLWRKCMEYKFQVERYTKM